MTRVLILYGTCEGQTARIAEYIAQVIRGRGGEAHPADIMGAGPLHVEDYDGVIVGASVHMGKHENYVRDFVGKHRDALGRLPTAFFSVSLAAHDDTEAAREEVEGYIERFMHDTGWHPGKVGAFAGALLYTRYGFFKRWMMKKIAGSKGSPDTDTARDYIYTDWAGVEHFAEEFLDSLAPEDARATARA